MIKYSIARLPRMVFGSGELQSLPAITRRFGQNMLLVTGGSSFSELPGWQQLLDGFSGKGIECTPVTVSGEPSPDLVDDIVRQYSNRNIDVVVAIGGGSALDAAKAVAGLLTVGDTVMNYLEGVGPEKQYTGPALPFIAVPTTAGTGSEATKNAVLSIHGEQGFKKSFRDDSLVAEVAIIDPDLLKTCPQAVFAANGMDALTQLIESFVSLKSNPFTDALAVSGIRAAVEGMLPLYDSAGQKASAREQMSYAALQSGITLAQVGLGSVHGLASPLGAFYPMPHGAVCGTLLSTATDININSMLEREPDNVALDKYATLGEILCRREFSSSQSARQALIELLEEWTQHMKLPLLSEFGLKKDGLDAVVRASRGSSMKTNPIVLQDDELCSLLERRL